MNGERDEGTDGRTTSRRGCRRRDASEQAEQRGLEWDEWMKTIVAGEIDGKGEVWMASCQVG